MAYYSKMASAVYNDIVSGLRGYTSNPSMSLELLEDEIAEERLYVIKQYVLKGIVPKRDILKTISCIPIDCKDIENCTTCGQSSDYEGTPTMHFEIPPLLTDFGNYGLDYIGSADMLNPFVWYLNPTVMSYRKYKKRGKDKPYVYINTSPNENGKWDCWVYNAPFLKRITVVGVFKDERHLDEYGCSCSSDETGQFSFLDSEIKDRVIQKKIKYYRQLAAPVMSNNQIPQ